MSTVDELRWKDELWEAQRDAHEQAWTNGWAWRRSYRWRFWAMVAWRVAAAVLLVAALALLVAG